MTRGLVSEQRRFERGQLLVGLQPTEALGGLHHAGGGPTQRHLGVAPSLHVATDAAHRPHHVLDRIGAGKRPPEFERLNDEEWAAVQRAARTGSETYRSKRVRRT